MVKVIDLQLSHFCHLFECCVVKHQSEIDALSNDDFFRRTRAASRLAFATGLNKYSATVLVL